MSDNEKLIELTKQEIRRRAYARLFRFDESELLSIRDGVRDFVMLRSRKEFVSSFDEEENYLGEVEVNKPFFWIEYKHDEIPRVDKGDSGLVFTYTFPATRFVSIADYLIFVIQDGVARGLDGSVITLPQGERT